MKIIKFCIICVIAVMASLYVTSCSKEYSSPLKGQVVKDLTFESSQSSNTVTIADADLTGFTIKSSELWCTAAAQGKVLSVTVRENDTYDDRQATITVTDPGDQTTITFKVMQKQNDAILIDGSTFVVPEEGGDINIKIQSNVNYEVEIPASATWLTKSTRASTRGLESSTIVLTAEKNNSGEEREAIVTFIDKESGVSSKITIKQSLTPYIEVDKDQITLSEDEKEIEIVVKTNINLETVITNDWITDNGRGSNGDLNFTQKLKIAKNNSGDERGAVVTFENKNYRLISNISIKQSLTPYIEIEKNQISLSENEQEIEIVVKSNISVKTTITNDWITDIGIENNGDFNYTQKLKVSAFSGRVSRSAVVTFKSQSYKWNLKKEATITQTKEIKYVAGNAIDLGLSVLWSDINLGATTPESFGEYFAWGETKPKEQYSKDNYMHYDHSMNQYLDIGEDISGTKYDAAHVNLGNGWRMPSNTELQELIKNCEWEWVKSGNTLGYKITGKHGNYIFMPAGGCIFYSTVSSQNEWTEYWSSSERQKYKGDAYLLVENGYNPTVISSDKIYGVPIRPVKSK